jgi:hypothetical protein
MLLTCFTHYSRAVSHQEYCCHKVDKRIAEIIRRRNKQRQAKATALARKEAAGDFSHLKGGASGQAPLPQPTLPNIALDDDDLDDGSSMRTRGPPPSTFTQNDAYYPDQKTAYAPEYEYPPMPAYTAGAYPQQGYEYGQHGTYNAQAAQAVYGDREPYFNDGYPHDNYAHDGYTPDGYASATHIPLTHAAAPPGGAHDGHDLPAEGRHTPPGIYGGGGLAYEQDYPSPTSAGPPPRSLAVQQQQAFDPHQDGLSYDWTPQEAHAHGHAHGQGHDAGVPGGRGFAM